MRFKDLHRWDLTPKNAVALQRELAGQVTLVDQVPDCFRLVAGVDVSYRKRAEHFHAAVVVLDFPNLQIVETATASGQLAFPYVPGLLSFRELPILLKAFRKLQMIPDVVMADGQGIAHPRRLGLASHLGLWLDLPTIGCAKTRLCGEARVPGEERGAWTTLLDCGDEIGRMVRTRDGVRPLFISPGHKINCDRAVEVVLQCGRGYRLPEPTRQAHLLSNRLRLLMEAGGA
jgi:deoxyribonuclease V